MRTQIGGHLDVLKMPPLAVIAVLEYQSILALAFLLGRPAGSLMLRGMLAVWQYPRSAEQPVTVDMCHHYAGFIQEASRTPTTPLVNYTPKVPTLFAYAAHKPFFFHSAVWLERVRASPGGEVAQFECGHWIPHEAPEQWHALLLRWLQQTEALAPPAVRNAAD